MDKALFQVARAEIVEPEDTDASNKNNPYLTIAKFVFADDKGAPLSTAPAGLLQGIEAEDFDEVIRTSLNMPLKMRYLGGDSVGNHLGSSVIGHITGMQKAQAEDGTNQLIAEAVIYAEEFPEEVNYLKTAYAEGKAPGISYEIIYKDSIIKNGVQWLKNLVTTAATLVRDPAYGKRTALLALASAKTDEELVASMKAFIAQAEGSNPNDKGGISVTEEELEQIKAEAARNKAEAETKTAENSRLMEELTAANAKIDELQGQVKTLESERILEGRVRRLADAGFPLEADAEKATKTKNFVMSLTDEAFDTYLESISAVKTAAAAAQAQAGAAGTAFASRETRIPRPDVTTNGNTELPTFRFR